LTPPLLVEAAESLFHPVCVYNNAPGVDEEVLKAFGEPAWNNPVVRIVGADRKDLAPRMEHGEGAAGFAARMIAGYVGDPPKRRAPAWLKSYAEELALRAAGVATLEFHVSCFWEGEVGFAACDGVLSTEAGVVDGSEIVRVVYAPSRVAFDALIRFAATSTCAKRVFARDEKTFDAAEALKLLKVRGVESAFRPDAEPKYRLRATPWRHVPMTELQALRANAMIAAKKDPSELFSPRQIDLFKKIVGRPKAPWPDAIHAENFAAAWEAAQVVAASRDR
jgi:hypothetical protein